MKRRLLVAQLLAITILLSTQPSSTAALADAQLTGVTIFGNMGA